MSDYKAPLRDMRFVLNEVFQVSRLWASLPGLADVIDEETAAAILEEAGKITGEVIAPLNRATDEQGCTWSNGSVDHAGRFCRRPIKPSPKAVGSVSAEIRSTAAWACPRPISAQVEEMVNSASLSFGLYPMLTAGACLSIKAHASEELKARYLPNMYAGTWTGSMCLTEAHAGTDLGMIRTTRRASGRRQLQGQRQQDLHHRRRPRPDREHHPPGSGATAGCTGGPERHLAVPGAQGAWSTPTASLGAQQRAVLRLDRTQDGHPGLRHLRDELRRRRGLIWSASRTRAWRRCSP